MDLQPTHRKISSPLKTKTIVIGVFVAVIILAFVMFSRIDASLFSSVLNVTRASKITDPSATTKTVDTKLATATSGTETIQPISEKKLIASLPAPTPVSLDSCSDTDGGKNYTVRGTITTIIAGKKRIEQDSCNNNGTLREWFCGHLGEPAGLLRSENYVDCGGGYSCQDGACVQAQGTGDAVIQDMFISPDPNPIVGTDNTTNKINITVKNIGNGTLSIPQTNGSGVFTFECYYIGGYGGFSSAPTVTSLAPGASVTTQLYIAQASDIFNRYNSLGSRYIQCTIISQQQQGMSNPSPSYTGLIYESNGNNNTFTLHYDVIDTSGSQTSHDGYGDIIIQSLTLLPTTTPALYSDFSTNTFQVVVKNIGTGTILLPMNTTNNLAIQIPFICYFPDGGDGAIFSPVLTQNTLGPNQSITTSLESFAMPVLGLFGTPGTKSMTCEIISQQQQLSVNPGLVLNVNNQYMMYETNGTNNSFTTTYEVVGQPAASGDIVINDMYLTPTHPVVGTNNDTNKFNLVIKNIGVGTIHIPEINGFPRFGLVCNYGNGAGPLGGSIGGFTTTAISGTTTLSPNTSVYTQINAQGNDSYSRFDTTGTKFMTCTVTSQQQQGRQTTNPNDPYSLYEANGTNNTRSVSYDVVTSK